MKRTILAAPVAALAAAALGVSPALAVNGNSSGARVDGTPSDAVVISVVAGYGCYGSAGGGYEVTVYNSGAGRADVNQGRCTSGQGQL